MTSIFKVSNCSIVNLISSHPIVTVLLAGIRCPSMERPHQLTGEKQPAEPFAKEAHAFVETRLLQRNVQVEVVSITPHGQVFAQVVHPRGSIAMFLLQAGLANCNDAHVVEVGTKMMEFRQAEKQAQEQKIGQFRDFVAKPSTQPEKNEATVVRVQAGDTIYVRSRAGDEKRIGFSSIRAPRGNDPTEGPYRDEAKEYVRKKLIGKHVQVAIDGKVPPTGDYEAKDAATVTLNNKNIALQLIQEGLATIIRHRKDDNDKSPIYGDLHLAEAKAKEDKKGIHSGKPPKSKPYTDASESLQVAKRHLPSLQRQSKIPAIIDFIKSGSRFVVLIPREQIKLTLVLTGIRSPKPARNANEKPDPFGPEALNLAVKRLQQRDVEISVSSLDKVGGFIGSVFISKESFAKILLEEGLATIHSTASNPPSSELAAAEQRARDARKHIWISYNPALEAAAAASAAGPNGSTNTDEKIVPRPRDYRNIMITHITPDGKLKIQLLGPSTAALEKLMGEFSTCHSSPTTTSSSLALPQPPKAGDYVSAKFSEDGCWYRALIRSNDRTTKTAEVVYIDYGNDEKRPWDELRILPAQFSIQKLKAQAHDAVLSLVQFPSNKDYLSEAIAFLRHLVEAKELVANIDFEDKDGGSGLKVTVYDKERNKDVAECVNREVVEEGWGTLKKRERWERWERGFEKSEEGKVVLEGMGEGEAEAREGRRGVWEYGDLGDEE